MSEKESPLISHEERLNSLEQQTRFLYKRNAFLSDFIAGLCQVVGYPVPDQLKDDPPPS